MIIKSPELFDIVCRPDLAVGTGSAFQVVAFDKDRNNQLLLVPLGAIAKADIDDNFTTLLKCDGTNSRFGRLVANGPIVVVGKLTPQGTVLLNEGIKD